MRFLLKTMIILAALSITATAKTDAEIKAELVGVWQNSESVGSGLTDNYQFFENGRFKFNSNEMDGEKRTLSISGFWNVHKGRLYLHANRKLVLVGGKRVRATGSIATDYEISGGRVVLKRIAPIKKSSHDLSGFMFEEEMYTTVLIDGEKFWKLSTDPSTYANY